MNLLTTRISLKSCASVTELFIGPEMDVTFCPLTGCSTPLVVQLTVMTVASNTAVAVYNATKFLPLFGIDKTYKLGSLSKCLVNIC